MTDVRSDANALVRHVSDDPSLGGVTTVALASDDARGRNEWSDYVQRAVGAELYHDYRWRAVIERLFGHETHYLVAREAGRVRGVLPLVRLRSRLFGDFMVSMPYMNYGGVLADSPAVAMTLLGAACRRADHLGCRHVELRHRGLPEIAWPARDDKVSMLLDLPESEAELWNRFKPKLRAQIRRPEKAGGVVRRGGPELLDDFYAVFSRNMRDLGTPVYPQRFFEAIADAFAQETRIYVVDLGGRPAAAGFVLGHRTTAEIPWASSLREANPMGVNMLLYWTALRDAVAQGFRRFDFGRSSKNSGTFHFKAQWGAQPLQLRWHYWIADGRDLPQLNPNNPKYRAAIALWRHLPLYVANILGPHIVKNLP
jgi:FemAB-related protein (PEP-CTERM system-associated)